jgi:hypothetical protein
VTWCRALPTALGVLLVVLPVLAAYVSYEQ